MISIYYIIIIAVKVNERKCIQNNLHKQGNVVLDFDIYASILYMGYHTAVINYTFILFKHHRPFISQLRTSGKS